MMTIVDGFNTAPAPKHHLNSFSVAPRCSLRLIVTGRTLIVARALRSRFLSTSLQRWKPSESERGAAALDSPGT